MRILTSIKLILIGLACSTLSHGSTVLMHDTFTLADGSAARNRASSPVAGPANWAGSPNFTVTNNTLRSAASGSGHVLTMNFGVDYFNDNPGIYTLSADVFFASEASTSGQSWQIGFNDNTNSSAGANRNLDSTANSNTYLGAPGLILRGDGVLIARLHTEARIQTAANAFPAGQTHNLKLELNTLGSAWTVNAFVNDVAFDLNSENPDSSTFTFTTNPTIRYLTISSTITAASNSDFLNYMDNVQMTVIPEPSTLLLVGATIFGALAFVRRRRCAV